MELLARCERWQHLEDHAYVSMASYTMEDQKLAHRLLGIRRLLAFDFDEGIVERQRFNRPIGEAKCVALKSGDVAADIEKVLHEAGITDNRGYIVWLDYTDPKAIGEQIREFEQLAAQLAPGDVVRVTINADYTRLAGRRNPNDNRTKEQKQQTAFDKLTADLGEFLPNDLAVDSMSENGLASALSRAFGLAADRAVPASGDLRLMPLSIVRYADGMQMLSMTSTICRIDQAAAVREKLSLDTWPFSSADWGEVKFLAVPDLTVRERLFLEQHIEETDEELIAGLGFDLDSVTEMEGFVANFRSYYRHYPALSPVEL